MNKLRGYKVVEAGTLVSATDLEFALKLGRLVRVDELTGGAPARVRAIAGGNLEVQTKGELYELARV